MSPTVLSIRERWLSTPQLKLDKVIKMLSVSTDDLREMIGAVTGDSVAVSSLSDSSPLLETIPELDSLAIVNLLLAMENKYNFQVDDDEVETSIFQSLDSLRNFAQTKISRLNGDSCRKKQN